MIIILTDTTEEEDVDINKWLVNERLAQFGKTVRMFDIIHNLKSNTIESSTRIESSIETFHAESAGNVNISRHINQSTSRDERRHRLSDVKSEDSENKTVKSLSNLPISKKGTIRMLQMLPAKSSSAKSLNAEFQDVNDAKSQSRKYVQNRESRKLIPLENLKTLSQSGSSPNASISDANTDNEDNARRIDSNGKAKSRNSSDDYNRHNCMNFSLRNSDDENNTEDFGTFRSLYGGRGFMEAFDWSVIREENNRPRETTAAVSNLDPSIGKENVDDKSGLYSKKNEIPGKRYFLNVTSMERENFLPENNIDNHNVENMSDFIETLRNEKTPNHIVTVMFAPNDKFETLDSIQSEDTSDANKLNDIPSSREMDQGVDKNGEMCVHETRVDWKTESEDFNTVSESASSDVSNNENNINREMSEGNTPKSNTKNKVYHPMYKMLLDQMMRLNSNSNESSSSKQILSSSYSYNTVSDDTIISSNDKQSNCTDTNSITTRSLVKELESTFVQLPKNQILNESRNDTKETALSSIETDSTASSNVDDIKQCQWSQSSEVDSLTSSNDDMEHCRSLDSNSIASTCNDNSKRKLNTVDDTVDVSRLMQRMLKIVRDTGDYTELDSDDLSSSRESVNDESDESNESNRDNKLVESDCTSETFQSMSNNVKVTKMAFRAVFNDCNIKVDESESDAEEEELFRYLKQHSSYRVTA